MLLGLELGLVVKSYFVSKIYKINFHHICRQSTKNNFLTKIKKLLKKFKLG